MSSSSSVSLEPLRSLDDFILSSARFQVPAVADLERWNKRVKENLIYYQTNYFLTATIIFLLVGVFHPKDMLVGTLAAAAFLGGNYLMENQTVIQDFKKRYPLPALLLIVGLGYLVVSLLSSVLVFFFGICLPVLVCFIHASLRLRDTKNKISNFKEKLSLKTTPMGMVLDALGMSFEGFQ